MTPSVCQKAFSAPQKQPRPKMAVRAPSGHGGVSEAPLTWWRSVMTMGSSRPGSASAGDGMVAGRRKRNMGEWYARPVTKP